MSNRMKAGFVYLFAVHALLAVILHKSDFIDKIEVRLGLEKPTMDFYEKMTVVHRIMDASISDNSVLFVGDSIIQALNTSVVSDLSVNFGIYSDTTQGVVDRLPLYQSLERARAVVLAIGINDIHRSVDRSQTLANYRDILEFIPSNIRVLASSILPIGENRQRAGFSNVDISLLNSEIADMVAGYDNVTYLDTHAEFVNSEGLLAAELHIGDGVHLSSEGYRLLILQFRDAVSVVPQVGIGSDGYFHLNEERLK